VTAAQQDVQYSGADGFALSTSVQTGAAGLYQGLSITRNPGVSSTMTVRAAQVVQVAADQALPEALIWGTGDFVIQEAGSLSLSWMDLPGDTHVDAGGSLAVVRCVIRGAVTAEGDVEATSTLFAEGSSFHVSGDGTVQEGTFDRTELTIDGQLNLAQVDVACGSSLEVENGGAVTISESTLGTPVTVDPGAGLQLAMVSSADFPQTSNPVDFGVAPGGTFTAGDPSAFDPQCFEPYELLTDAWRKSSTAGGSR
jgi:hypothetical protein